MTLPADDETLLPVVSDPNATLAPATDPDATLAPTGLAPATVDGRAPSGYLIEREFVRFCEAHKLPLDLTSPPKE